MAANDSETVPILNEAENQHEYGAATSRGRHGTATSRRRTRRQLHYYPIAVTFILISKFFESFSANGVRTVIALYLRSSLNFTEGSATAFFHIFNFFSQFCPIFGAIIADSYIGNVKTIFHIYFFYACGWIGMIVFTFPMGSIPTAPFVIVFLLLIAIGNGGIRACVTSLGGKQFVLPYQSAELERYFSQFYFVYTLGIMSSKIISPEIRAQTQCFGKSECYSAVYGALGTIFLTSWIIFLVGIPLFREEQINQESGNMIFRFIGCIWYGIKQRLRGYNSPNLTGSPWIDGSVEKYPESFVKDVSAFMKLLKLCIPLTLYWTLFTQIDSNWTFQASQLNTNIFGFKIEADQAKGFGALLLLFMIPFWKSVCVPLLAKCNIELSPLKCMALGGLSAVLSFVCAGMLQYEIERYLLIDPSGTNKLSILWQFPQFFLIMLGEIWLSMTGLAFAFRQAPATMQSVMTAAWYCNNAFGNLIVVIITESRLFQVQSVEYFFYASIMLLAVLIFCWFATTYQYTDQCDSDGKATQITRNGASYTDFSSEHN